MARAEGREPSFELRIATATVRNDAPRVSNVLWWVHTDTIIVVVVLAGSGKDKPDILLVTKVRTFRIVLRAQINDVIRQGVSAYTQVRQSEPCGGGRHGW